MIHCIGIRKETKDKTQQRAPLSPDHVRQLVRKHKIAVLVEPWDQRVFKDKEYARAGATISPDLRRANIIFGVKEIAPEYMYDDQAYCFFSHTIKGQSYNMPMLRNIMRRRNTLFDYELVKNEEGKRLIFFGDYAGYAGMIDSIWALGRRLDWEGMHTPFSDVKYATHYERLSDAEKVFRSIGRRIRTDGLPKSISPFITAFTGYGHVSKAAQQLFDLFPVQEVEPEDLPAFYAAGKFSRRVVYKVRFRKPDMFRHRKGRQFDVDEFTNHPNRFSNMFHDFVPYFTLIINGIYWEPRFPRLLTKRYIKALYGRETHPRLRVIGDITCDIEGSIELTVKETNAQNPVFVYEAKTGKVIDGWEGKGPVVLAVDKLPTELPLEASESFGTALLPFVPGLAAARFNRPLSSLNLSQEFAGALIVHRGKLTPSFRYLREFLTKK